LLPSSGSATPSVASLNHFITLVFFMLVGSLGELILLFDGKSGNGSGSFTQSLQFLSSSKNAKNSEQGSVR
jgi:hypothetical protein